MGKISQALITKHQEPPIRPIERNPRFTNPLIGATSPYLRQHAHNPVFWYPWSREALDRARVEGKPILLSIGYSTCYWCHVMEREVFENLSIASLMNRCFINIKIDREEYPELDQIYMVARQLMTHEGGWPNNVFLTPDLKPFYAGGTYAADESYGRPAFPRLLEWLNNEWMQNEQELRARADVVSEAMQPHLVYSPPPPQAGEGISELFTLLKNHYDARAGGFFQAPKFPHECFLSFLLSYYEHSGAKEALDMVTHSLSKMAAGGIYDHVACGFHRYAVDKEWYVPHFEKMLYNQALLARLYADAARLSGNAWLADIATGILDFVSGPLTDGNGAFYAAIDAETDGVEGAYYAWEVDELKTVLTPGEITFFTAFYALADIPQFPGHKHAKGQVIIARKPLDIAAREHNMPYVQLAALSGQVMNKLLDVRNKRQAPRLDDKIIVSWNGLMIDAFAHVGKIFNKPEYMARAAKAANFLLEHAIDNNGDLKRIYAGGKAQLPATLEDYAYFTKGLLSLHRADGNENWPEAALSLMHRAEELFADSVGGYFYTQAADNILIRIKSGDDSMLPSPNAVMVGNMMDVFEITRDAVWRDKAQALADYFLSDRTLLTDSASMAAEALRLTSSPSPLVGEGGEGGISQHNQASNMLRVPPLPNPPPQGGRGLERLAANLVTITATVSTSGDTCEATLTLTIAEGWHINANPASAPFLIATQVEIQGEGVEALSITYPPPMQKKDAEGEALLVYEGVVQITAKLKFTPAHKRPPIKAMLRYQPCHGTACYAVRDMYEMI